jgi:pimeloyl-ACP methyl ester carboxylesterase
MDHLRIDKFAVMGFCIGGPFIWNLLKRAPNRVVAAVLAQPVGFRPEMPGVLYDGSKTGWAPEFLKRRSDVTPDTVEKYLTKMFRTDADFVFTVTRDFVRSCQTPVLILPTMSRRTRWRSRWRPRSLRRNRKSACIRGSSRPSGFRSRCGRSSRSSRHIGPLRRNSR